LPGALPDLDGIMPPVPGLDAHAPRGLPPPSAREGSPFEQDGFQARYAVPIGAAATGLAIGSLGFLHAMGRKSGKDAIADATAQAGDLEATTGADADAAAARALDAAATDEAAPGAPTLTPDNRVSTWLKNAAVGMWKETDLYSALRPGDDKEFRDLLMNPPTGQVSLPQRRAQLVEWDAEIQAADLPAALKAHFRESINDTIATLDGLTTQTNPWSRGAKLVAQAILTTPISIVLPLFAIPIERQQVDVIIASYVKTTLLRVGLAARATTNNAVIRNNYLNRDFANVIQSLALSLNLYPQTRKVADNPAYSIAAALVSAGLLAYTFYPNELKALPGKAGRALKQGLRYVTGGAPPAPAERAARVGGVAAADVSDSGKALLQGLSKEVFAARARVDGQRAGFKASGKSLTDSADWQFGQLVKGYYDFARELEAFTASDQQLGGSIRDPDRAAKLGLAALSGAICLGVTAEFFQNNITVVDMGVDALFNIYNNFKQALDPNVSWQQSLDTFKNWTSLSVVMAPTQAANLIAGGLVEKSDANMLAGAGVLTAANLLVAGPVGAGIKQIVGRCLARAQDDAEIAGDDRITELVGDEEPDPIETTAEAPLTIDLDEELEDMERRNAEREAARARAEPDANPTPVPNANPNTNANAEPAPDRGLSGDLGDDELLQAVTWPQPPEPTPADGTS
jgi:hypothetical protein